MSMLTPIKITFYDKKTQEVLKEYSQSIITFDMLIRASQLSTAIENQEEKAKQPKRWWMWWEKKVSKEAEQIKALLQLVTDFFENQFTLEDLQTKADISEVMTVLQSIMTRANRLTTGNPTRPRRTRSR